MQLPSSHSGHAALFSDDAQATRNRRINFEPEFSNRNTQRNDQILTAANPHNNKRKRREFESSAVPEYDQAEEGLSRLESVRKMHAAGTAVTVKESQSTRQSRLRIPEIIPMLHFQFLGFNGIRSRRPNPQEQQHISTNEVDLERPNFAMLYPQVSPHRSHAPPHATHPHGAASHDAASPQTSSRGVPHHRTNTYQNPFLTHFHTHFHRHTHSHIDPHAFTPGVTHTHAHSHTQDSYDGGSYSGSGRSYTISPSSSIYGAPAMQSVATLSGIPQLQQVPLLGQSHIGQSHIGHSNIDQSRNSPRSEAAYGHSSTLDSHRFVYIDHDHFVDPLPPPPPIGMPIGLPSSLPNSRHSDLSWLEQRDLQEAQNRSLEDAYAEPRQSGLTAANLLPPLPLRPSPEGYTTSLRSLEEEIVCTSCSEPLDESVLLRVCGHLYCRSCSKLHTECQAPHCKNRHHKISGPELFREVFL